MIFAGEQMLLSVIITSYNYASYVAQAIDSALKLDWPNVEVIVVDDGSTDASREVIEGYADRVQAVFTENRGQVAASNTGFELSRGDVVIFLDADDLLDSSLMRELERVWNPGVSKVQFQMKLVDSEGKATGSVLPQYGVNPSPKDILQWASTAAAYPTPPGSGNAYNRSFLQKIFPLGSGDQAADSFCLAAAPFLGDVVTIAKPLVSYRVHGKNQGAMSHLDPARLAKEVRRALFRFRYGQDVAARVGIRVPDTAFDNSMNVLPYRLASYCLAPTAHPIAGDGRLSILKHMARATLVSQGRTSTAQVALLCWGILLSASPEPIRQRLVLWRFNPTSRPKALSTVLRASRIVKLKGTASP